jgi:hypothetical protein
VRRRRLTSLAVLVLAAVVGAGPAAENARSALFFLLEPTSAEPGDVVTVRTGGTPATFALRQRVKPYQRPIRLYLVPNRLVPDVHSRFDSRTHFVGSLVPDARGRGLLRFTVPALESDDYTVGAWCPGCAPYSRGRTWSAIHVTEQNVVARYRPFMLLRVTMPPATADTCPATNPNGNVPSGLRSRGLRFHGNRMLAVAVRGRSYLDPDGDGLVGEKMIWIAGPVEGALNVRYWRIDVPGPARETRGIAGTFGAFAGPSWASRMSFTEGCWKITGRVRNISVSFVVRVVVTQPRSARAAT